MDFIAIIVAFMGGIAGAVVSFRLPPGAVERAKTRPPLGKPGDPPPGEVDGPFPLPWLLITGLVAGLGGALAEVGLGREFATRGLVEPVVLGLLGGVCAAWAVASVRVRRTR